MKEVVRVKPTGTSMKRTKKSTRRMSLDVLLAMVVKRQAGFEDSRVALQVGHVRTTRQSRKLLVVPSVRGIIGFGRARTTSRRSEGSMPGGTHRFGVVSWIGTTCRCVKVLVICVRTTQRLSRNRQADLGRLTFPIALLLPQERQPLRRKAREGGRCFGGAVELGGVDVPGVPGLVADDLEGGAVAGHPRAPPERRMKAITTMMHGMVKRKMSITTTRKVLSMRKRKIRPMRRWPSQRLELPRGKLR